jgi:hypothetical protein
MREHVEDQRNEHEYTNERENTERAVRLGRARAALTAALARLAKGGTNPESEAGVKHGGPRCQSRKASGEK